MKYLFTKDQIRQSLRFGLAGGWKNDINAMQFLRSMEKCPLLMSSFLPADEQVIGTTAVPTTTDPKRYNVDCNHTNIRVWNSTARLSIKTVGAEHIPTGGLRNCIRNTPFISRLVGAYKREYKVTDIVDLGNKRLEVKTSVSFTDG